MGTAWEEASAGGESRDEERMGYACSSGGGVDGGESGGGGGVKTEYLEPRFLTPFPSAPSARAKAERVDEPELRREPGERWMR